MHNSIRKVGACARMAIFLAVMVGLVFPLQAVQAAGPVVLIANLQPSWTALGGGGVYSAYRAAGTDTLISPGATALYDGRQAGIIKAGLTSSPGSTGDQRWDEGLFGFKPYVTINVLAAWALTYDVENQTGANPVWMTIEIDTGLTGEAHRDDNESYQSVPASYGAANGWHTVDAGAGQWQLMDADGNGTGPVMSLTDLATARTGLNVVRAYLRLGMGDSYSGTGDGTIAWVDKAKIGGVTYDFVHPTGNLIVTPNSNDWAFVNDNGTSGDWTAGFQTGPGTPPLGTGSAYMHLSSASAGIILITQKYQGTLLSDIQTLGYSTYTNASPAAMAFQINYDPDLASAGPDPWYGRLVYEPYINGTVTNGAWQTWDTINGGDGKWWASDNANSPVDNTCTQASPCTWNTLISTWPNIGIRNDALSGIVFKAGSGWNGFAGNVDNLTVEIGGGTDTYDFEPLPMVVYVNSAYTPGSCGGHICNYDAFPTIGEGVTGVASGGTVNVAAGTFAENVVVNKPVTIVGAGIDSTFVIPAMSSPNPCAGSSLCGGAASNVFLVQANNVTIHDLTIDGDNPALTSAYNVGGANIDARNGIIKNTDGTYDSLEVYNTLVKNIYLRGIYSTAGTFNFHNNTVTNVRAEYASIAMFAWYGPGVMQNNHVSYANDAISANHSKGIQFLNNTVTNSGSGVHTDNAGDGGGVADVIRGNTVSDCDLAAGGYGIFVFVPYIAPSVKNNTVTNCQYGLSAWGQGATVLTRFTGNTVTGPGTDVADSVGAYITTDEIGYGYNDVAVSFAGNVITNNETGVMLTADQPSWEPGPFVAKSIVAAFHCNQIDGNGTGVDKGVNGTISNDFTYNWWGSATGPAASDNPTGTGDSVVDGIVYSPWLTSSTCSSVPPYITSTTITSDAPDPSSPNQSVTINFNVANILPGGPVPAGTVNVSDGATVICSAVALDSSGNGSCNHAFTTSGSHTLTASFTPTSTDSFQTSSGTAAHMVTTVVTRQSVAFYDGWILEAGELASTGGAMDSTATTFILGDDAANRQYRSILSFSTKLPTGAVVTKVTLRIKQSGAAVGTNPFSVLGNVAVDIKKGAFGMATLQLTDFNASPTKSGAMTILKNPVSGWYSTTLTTGVNTLINKGGKTQFRLRFKLDDNNNFAANYLKFFSGNALTGNRPQLEIEYYVP